MWRFDFLLLLLFTTSVDYFAARFIHAADPEDRRRRRRILIGALTINIGLLIFFKYSIFLAENLIGLYTFAGYTPPKTDWLLELTLPLGISFYTFHSISYTIDVYRRVVPPIHRYVIFFTYVTFWPQMIAGPILRAGEVVPQLENPPARVRSEDFVEGIERILIGLFKKVILADSIGTFVDIAFAKDPVMFTAYDVLAAALLFGFQIYFDFSAYSDIAIGSAKLVGIRFPENFDWPYLSSTPKNFWQRWHISLSSWIRLVLPIQTEASAAPVAVPVADRVFNRNRSDYFAGGHRHEAGAAVYLFPVLMAVYWCVDGVMTKISHEEAKCTMELF